MSNNVEQQDVVLQILHVKEVYTYTIPSISAITVKLRHVIIVNDNLRGRYSHTVPTVDIFFCEGPLLTSVSVPTKVRSS